jgi:hypothetical protein
MERLSASEDGRVAFRMKRPLPDGRTHLVFTPVELLRKLAALVPPPRSNLVRFHGVFAPGSKLRPFLLRQAPIASATLSTAVEATELAPSEPPSGQPKRTKESSKREAPPRGAKGDGPLDWADLLRRTFAIDVLRCDKCGERRRVLAHVTGKGAKAILEHLGLPSKPLSLAPATGPPTSAWMN